MSRRCDYGNTYLGSDGGVTRTYERPSKRDCRYKTNMYFSGEFTGKWEDEKQLV